MARKAQRGWAETGIEARAQVLRKTAELAEAQCADLADWIGRESGSVRAKAEFELVITIRSLREGAAMPSQAQGLVCPAAAIASACVGVCRSGWSG